MSTLRYVGSEILGTLASCLGTITAWQDQLDWSVRIIAGLMAITAAIFTIRSARRKDRQDTLQDLD